MFNLDKSLSEEEKVIKAKVQLQKTHPFFAYILSQMVVEEREEVKTMGVDSKGHLFYNKGFVSSLTLPELKGVLCHEALHTALEHFGRAHKRNKEMWNIATDIVVNNMLLINGLTLPESGIIPQDDSITLLGTTIDKISEKTAEGVYNLLPEVDKVSIPRFDVHIYSCSESLSKPNGSESGKSEPGDKSESGLEKSTADGLGGDEDEKSWSDVLINAEIYAQMRGTVPKGMKRFIDRLLKPQIPWYRILYEFVVGTLPVDWTWSYPSKRSIGVGVYLPKVKRESLDVVVTIDTSGSISRKTLTLFVSELAAIINAFEGLKMTILIGDADVNEIIEVQSGDLEKVMKVDFRGGGGTDHKPFYKWIEKNRPECQVIVNLTDGETDFPEREISRSLWVIQNSREIVPPFGKVKASWWKLL